MTIHQFGVSGLLRRYAPSDSEVAWNRVRSRFARSLVAATSTTERLAAGLAVLEGCAGYLADLAEAWVTNRIAGQRLAALNRQGASLLAYVDALAPEQASDPLAGPVDQPGGMLTSDPMHGVAQGIVRNLASRLDDPSGYAAVAAVAAFAGDTIVEQLNDARHEPWALLGLDGPPLVLDRLVTLLAQLATVLVERALGDTTPSQIASVIRSMPSGQGLARAAGMARAAAGPTFPHAAQAMQLTRKTRRKGSKKWRTETSYAITSLPAAQARPGQLAEWIGGHWTIENKLHRASEALRRFTTLRPRCGYGPRACWAWRQRLSC